MNRHLSMLVSLAALTMTLALSGCGASNRILTLIAVSPASAQPADPAGVQFTATGTFNQSPIMVSPLPVTWSFTGVLSIPNPPLVSIDSNGVAHCNGFKGSVAVYAMHSTDPNAAPAARAGPGTGMRLVSGTAMLSCK